MDTCEHINRHIGHHHYLINNYEHTCKISLITLAYIYSTQNILVEVTCTLNIPTEVELTKPKPELARGQPKRRLQSVVMVGV
jgi:hypothetical protein